MFSLGAPPQGGHSVVSVTEQHPWSWLAFRSCWSCSQTLEQDRCLGKWRLRLVFLNVCNSLTQGKQSCNVNSVALKHFRTQFEHYALHRCSICCRAVCVIVSKPWMYLFWPHVFVFCQTLSLCGTDEIIIPSVDFFCILFFFSLKACLFDLSLITFKHHKALECLFPCPLISKPFSLKTPSLCFHVCLWLTGFLLDVNSHLLFSPHVHLWFICFKEIKTLHFRLCHYSFCLVFFISIFLSKHSGGIEREEGNGKNNIFEKQT